MPAAFVQYKAALRTLQLLYATETVAHLDIDTLYSVYLSLYRNLYVVHNDENR